MYFNVKSILLVSSGTKKEKLLQDVFILRLQHIYC